MDHHPPPTRARRARRARPAAPTLRRGTGPLLAALVLVGCSSADPAGEELADRLADTGQEETTTTERIFADPGDVDGFDGVEDVEVEPTEPAPAASVELTAEEPEAVIEEVAEQLAASEDDDLSDGGEVLDAIEPIDQASTEPPVDDGRPRNEVGELVTLDEEASLACAQVEIALGHIDDGLPSAATERIVSAAERAAASGVADIQAWAEPLRAVVADGPAEDLAPLIGFLSVCTEGGYEL